MGSLTIGSSSASKKKERKKERKKRKNEGKRNKKKRRRKTVHVHFSTQSLSFVSPPWNIIYISFSLSLSLSLYIYFFSFLCRNSTNRREIMNWIGTHAHTHTHSVPESSGGVENDVLVRSSALIISKFFERSRRRLHTHTHTHTRTHVHTRYNADK